MPGGVRLGWYVADCNRTNRHTRLPCAAQKHLGSHIAASIIAKFKRFLLSSFCILD